MIITYKNPTNSTEITFESDNLNDLTQILSLLLNTEPSSVVKSKPNSSSKTPKSKTPPTKGKLDARRPSKATSGPGTSDIRQIFESLSVPQKFI